MQNMFAFGGIFHENHRPFNYVYKCYSVSMLPGQERQDVDNGGKIILPPSALEHLSRMNVVYPMLFKLSNTTLDRHTHCGVLEFVADEGRCYLPYWMMRNLMVDEGANLQVENATLPVASFSKFEPQSPEFLDITNPKAMLENALRSFACLTTGDVIGVRYNNRLYELRVLETRPGPAVSIIECDMDVEFAPPIGYEEPQVPPKAKQEEEEEDSGDSSIDAQFIPFIGGGNRLDGKTAGVQETASSTLVLKRRGVPDFDYNPGTIQFFRKAKFNSSSPDSKSLKSFQPFGGSGTSLRKKSITT